MADNSIPTEAQKRASTEISYYQWVPFILALQALLFYGPRLFWRLFNWQSGLNVSAIVTEAADSKNFNSDKRDETVETIAGHMVDTTDMQLNLSRAGLKQRGCCGLMGGTYVTVIYLVSKLLYLVNVIGQFFILNSFLKKGHGEFWGASVLNDVVHGRTWEESGHFPRVTMCDFQIRSLGQIHNYTVQCVLMINMFNEKVFLFLWWWFVLVAVFTCLNFLYWLFVTISGSSRHQFIRKYLKAYQQGIQTSKDSQQTIPFTNEFIRPDGIFVLRLISDTAGDIVTTALVGKLWESFKRDRRPTTKIEENEPLVVEKPIFPV